MFYKHHSSFEFLIGIETIFCVILRCFFFKWFACSSYDYFQNGGKTEIYGRMSLLSRLYKAFNRCLSFIYLIFIAVCTYRIILFSDILRSLFVISI